MNNASIAPMDLDDRIAAAFADGAKSDDVASLIREVEEGLTINRSWPSAINWLPS
jgi:hypothetical protein